MQSCNTFDCQPKIKTDYYNNKMPYTLLNTVRYKSNPIDGKIIRVYINKGFRFNGADIPKCLWWLTMTRFSPQMLPASCLHDYLCDNAHKYTIKQSTVMFRDVLILYGVNAIRANIMAFFVYLWQDLMPFNKKRWKK